MLNILRCGIALVVIGLFGCGGGGGGDGGAAPSGGGGGGGGGNPTPPPSTPVAISSTNQQKAAEVAVEPALSGLNVLASATAVQTTSASQPRLIQVLHAATNPLREQLGAGQVVAGVVQTISCSSGSITIDAADNGTSATTTFNACSFVAGSTMSGSITVSGISVGANNAISGSYTIDVTFVESGQPTFRIVGNFSINETCPTSSTCTTIFSGSSLGSQEGSEIWFISNFSITETNNSSGTSVVASYTVSSSILGGSVSVITNVPVFTPFGSLYPSQGQLVVTGAGSTVRVTINSSDPLNTMAVRVELDATNDGIFEGSQFYSWTTLESA